MAIREIFKKKLHDLLIAAGVGLFLGFLGPFGMANLGVSSSMLYWVSICLLGYGIYGPCIGLTKLLLTKKVKVRWHYVSIGALFAAIPMSIVILIVNSLFFNDPFSLDNFVDTFVKALIIGGVITLVALIKDEFIEKKQAAENVIPKEHEQLNKFMALLPLEKRGNLYCFESADHYLKVYTDKGHHLILMRFKDAMEMLVDYPGIQTHRSWWVALQAIQSVSKEQRKTILKLNNNIQVPVSKTYQDKVRQAGVY